MKKLQKDLREFQDKAGDTPPDNIGLHNVELRKRLIHEEYHELMEAFEKGDMQEIIKESIDLIYVVAGALTRFGIEIEPFWNAVHKSNLSKLEGMEVREDGKILKGPNYQPPDIVGEFQKQCYNKHSKRPLEKLLGLANIEEAILAAKEITEEDYTIDFDGDHTECAECYYKYSSTRYLCCPFCHPLECRPYTDTRE
jgi:phosphoribosyl-ATP pyrophosphohydrolase